jgi:hypothetical protein
MSHAYSIAHPDDTLPDGTSSRQASKRAVAEEKQRQADNPSDNGLGGGLNSMGARLAWRLISAAAHAEMNAVPGQLAEEEKRPIWAGFVNTGYCEGDRVKTTLRLPGANPGGVGWDPINPQTDEGVVQGPGRELGEIMVKFDYSGHVCSMKMGQITHVKAKPPATNLDRSKCRKSTIPRLSTL